MKAGFTFRALLCPGNAAHVLKWTQWRLAGEEKQTKIAGEAYNLGPLLVQPHCSWLVIRRASSLKTQEIILETTLGVSQKCEHKTKAAHQYLPAALSPTANKNERRDFSWWTSKGFWRKYACYEMIPEISFRWDASFNYRYIMISVKALNIVSYRVFFFIEIWTQ